MTSSHLPATKDSNPTLAQRLHAGIGRLTAVATAVIRGVREAMHTDAITRGHPTQHRSVRFDRVKRALFWARILNATLAGARLTVTGLAPKPEPPLILPDLATIIVRMATIPRLPSRVLTPLLPKPAVPMARAFSTQSIGAILTHICEDIGLAEAAPEWPAGLVGVSQTPAEWLAEHFPLTALPDAAPQPPPPPAPRKIGLAGRIATLLPAAASTATASGAAAFKRPFHPVRDPLPG